MKLLMIVVTKPWMRTGKMLLMSFETRRVIEEGCCLVETHACLAILPFCSPKIAHNLSSDLPKGSADSSVASSWAMTKVLTHLTMTWMTTTWVTVNLTF